MATEAKSILIEIKINVPELEAQSNKVEEIIRGIKKEQELLKKTTGTNTAEYKLLDEELRRNQQILRDNAKVLDVNKQQLDRNNASLKQVEQALNGSRAAYANLTKEQRNNAEVGGKLLTQIKGLTKEQQHLRAEMGQHQGNVGNYKTALSNLGGSIVSLAAGYLSLQGAMQLVRSIFSETREIDALDASYKLMITDTNELANTNRELKRISDAYGISINELRGSYIKFNAVTRGTALEGQKGIDIFEKVSKVLSLTGKSAEESNRVFMALTQMIGKGAVMSEELKIQLGDTLPIALKAMERATGLVGNELFEMMKKGKIISSEVLPQFAIELEKAIGAESVTKVETLNSNIKRSKTAWTDFVVILQSSGFFSTIVESYTSALEGLTSIIDKLTGGLKKAEADRNKLLSESLITYKQLNELGKKDMFAELIEKRKFAGEQFKQITDKTSKEVANAITQEYLLYSQQINEIRALNKEKSKITTETNEETTNKIAEENAKKLKADKDLALKKLKEQYEYQKSLYELANESEIELENLRYEYQKKEDILTDASNTLKLTHETDHLVRMQRINEKAATEFEKWKEAKNKKQIADADNAANEAEKAKDEFEKWKLAKNKKQISDADIAEKEAEEKKQLIVNTSYEIAKAGEEMLFEIHKNGIQRTLDADQKALEAKRELALAELEAHGATQEAKDRLNKEYEAKSNKLRYDAEIKEWNAQRLKIAVDAALAIAQIWAKQLSTKLEAGIPFAIAESAIVAAQAVAAEAVLSKNKPVLARGGYAKTGAILNGNSHAQGGIDVNMEGGEAVINKRSTAMFLPTLSKINQAGGGVPFMESGGIIPQYQQGVVLNNYFDMQNMIMEAIKSLPPQVVLVKDMKEGLINNQIKVDGARV